MREVRFRIWSRPERTTRILRAWFEVDPDARVHGTSVRCDDEQTWCTLVAFCKDSKRFADAMRALPVPAATRWEVEARGDGLVVVDCAWREPMIGEAKSAMRLGDEAFGPNVRASFTIIESCGIYRILLPAQLPIEPFWSSLVEHARRLSKDIGQDVRVELERLADLTLPVDPNDPEVAQACGVAFEMGLFDRPPLATADEVARYLRLPTRALETYVGDLMR